MKIQEMSIAKATTDLQKTKKHELSLLLVTCHDGTATSWNKTLLCSGNEGTKKSCHADIFAGKNYLKHLNESNKISETNLKSRMGVLVPCRAGK